MGKAEDAAEYQRRALEIAESKLGRSDMQVAATLSELGRSVREVRLKNIFGRSLARHNHHSPPRSLER